MRVPAVFMALSAFALSAVPVDAQLLKARGDQAQLRRGPGAEHATHSDLAGRDTVLQLGREGEWIATHRGWVEADSVEWTVPLEERGEPAVSVSPVVSIDSRVNKHAVSPNGSLIALSKLGGEREVLVFKTQDQQFVTRLDVADFGGYSDIAFLDENTLLLLKGDRTSGISEPEIPSDELVIDIPSGKTLFRGRGLFGYLGRNPHDREGHILSFTADLVRLHDPQSFETLAAIGTCSGDDVPCKEVESTFLDVSYDKAKDEISAIVNVEASARDNDSGFINPYYYYLIVRASSLSELADKISSLSGTRLDTDLETHFFTQIPAQDLFLTWKFGDAVGEPGATLVEAFDIQTKRLSGDFLFFGTEADIVICKDEQDIFGWTSGVPATGETIETVELTSIRLESDRSLVRNPTGMSLARNWSNGATVCLDPGRRASVREQAHIFSIDEGSTPEISQVDVQYNPYTFALRYEGEIIRWGVEFAESPIIDLDRLEEQAAPIEEFEDAESVRGYSFANPAGERVVTRTNDLGPIRIVNKDGRERIISDTEARNIFAGYVRSYDGSAMLVMSGQRKLSILNTVTGDLVEIREMANLDAYNEQYGTDRYLKEGWMGSSSSEGSTFAFSADGKLLHVLEQDASKIEVIDTSTGMKLREYPAELGWCGTAAATMPPNGRFACQDSDGINILNFQTGTIITRVPVSSFLQLSQLALDEQGRLLFQVTGEGILIHSIASGREIARLYMQRGSSSEQNGEATEPRWLLITTEGFYAGNTRSDELLQAAFGVDQVYAIDKFRDALYRPDLVAEALKGDPERLAAAAASEISLEKILHSGAAPEIRIRGDLAGDRVRAEADIDDLGGGVGRIEWRVNGVVQKTASGLPPAEDGIYTTDAELYLAEGENTVQLVAYNEANTIQARSNAMTFSVAASDVQPSRLFIMSVGVDNYALDRLKLEYAVRDAETVAATLAEAGGGLYTEVHTEIVLDEDVTRDGLAERFRSLAQRIRPNDVFVFFSAGHGKTIDGRFFYAPYDIDNTTVAAVREQGIGHSTWQEWFSTIPAQKSLLLFDSCESGALAESTTGRELRFRAANDLLGNSTGRALIAASSSTEFAMEGYEDHGVFTYSILDAMTWADINGDGVIDIDELASAIEQTVPRIAREVFGETQTPQYMRPHRGFEIVEQVGQL